MHACIYLYKDATDVGWLYGVVPSGWSWGGLTEYSRKGHWRLLSDGTRTWVSGHDVLREPATVTHQYDDAVLKRRLAEIIEKRTAAKAKKSAAKAQRKKARLARKAAKAQRAEK